MKEISLSQGKIAIVDDSDYAAVAQFKWCVSIEGRRFYAVRYVRKAEGGPRAQKMQKMHRFLMPGIPEIDHRDGNGLNNQRNNLRSVTRKQNLGGFQRRRVGSSSRFRGVTWFPRKKKWRAQITIDLRGIHLGYYQSEVEAAKAFDAAARTYRGENAFTNFPCAS